MSLFIIKEPTKLHAKKHMKYISKQEISKSLVANICEILVKFPDAKILYSPESLFKFDFWKIMTLSVLEIF